MKPRRPEVAMPQAVRFIVHHALIGLAIGLAFVMLILALDIAHIRSLASQSEMGLVVVGMLVVAFGATFGGAQIAFAIMLAPREDGDERR
jgi:hypothetical protein